MSAETMTVAQAAEQRRRLAYWLATWAGPERVTGIRYVTGRYYVVQTGQGGQEPRAWSCEAADALHTEEWEAVAAAYQAGWDGMYRACLGSLVGPTRAERRRSRRRLRDRLRRRGLLAPAACRSPRPKGEAA